MKTLDDWEKSGGWPVISSKDYTDGVDSSYNVIYDSVNNVVQILSTTVGATRINWGAVTSAGSSVVKGTTKSGWFFQITCTSGTLNGELAKTAFFGPSDHRGDGCDSATPGSWTASDGGQVHPLRHGEGEDEADLALVGPQREREALQV